MKQILLIIQPIVFFFLISSCESPNEPVNLISLSLESEKNFARPGDNVKLYCEAEDRDNDEITYVWNAPGGNFFVANDTAIWVAPDSVGSYHISCMVTDGNGTSDGSFIKIYVVKGGELVEEYIKNAIKLTKENFGTKYSYLYVVNTKPLYGDAYKDRKNKTKWKAFPVGEYPGKTKIEKKIDLINEINENFYSQGIKPKNIIMTGHSNGGYASLLYTARHPDKVRGAIAYHPACCGKLTKFDIATEKGRKKWLKDENWKCPIKEKGKYPCAEAFWTFRSKIIDEILSNKNLKAVVIHNNDDPYDGKHSEWLKEIKTVKFIETPGKKDNWKINGKSCKGLKPFGHNVHTSPCMSEYFPEIIVYFK